MSLSPNATTTPPGFPLRKQKMLQFAAAKFREAEDWVQFFREVLGVDGLIDQHFPSRQERGQFEKSDEFMDIQRMLAKLREQAVPPREPTKVITVRMPVSLHQSLSEEAHNLHTSINKLCISKLLQLIDDQFVPANSTWRPARTQPAPGTPEDSQTEHASQPIAGQPHRAIDTHPH